MKIINNLILIIVFISLLSFISADYGYNKISVGIKNINQNVTTTQNLYNITGSNINASSFSTACSGTDKVRNVTYSNFTGLFTIICAADETTAGGEPLWSANYTLFNSTWSSTFNSTYNDAWKYVTNNSFYPYTSNPFSYLNTSSETNWNANYSTFLTHINWGQAINGTLFKRVDWDSNYSANNDNWNNRTNQSYYLTINPFGFYNSTTLPAGSLTWADIINGTVYLSNNTYGFYNSTTLTELDPKWTGNQSNYYNITQVNDLIPSLLTYYFWDVNSVVNATYKTMNTTQNPTSTTFSAIGLTNGNDIVWRLNENTNITGFSSGPLHLHTSVTKMNGTKDLQIVGKLNKLLTNGTIVLIKTTDTSPILVTGVFTNINLFASINQQTLNATDRLLWRLEAVVSGGGTNPSVDVTVGGVTQNGLDLPVGFNNIILNELDPYWSDNFTKYNSSWSSIVNNSYALNTSLSLNYFNYTNKTLLSQFTNDLTFYVDNTHSYFNLTNFPNYANVYLNTTNQFSYFNLTSFPNYANIYLNTTNQFTYWNSTFATFNKTYADTLYATASQIANMYLNTTNQFSYYNATSLTTNSQLLNGFSFFNLTSWNNPYTYFNLTNFPNYANIYLNTTNQFSYYNSTSWNNPYTYFNLTSFPNYANIYLNTTNQFGYINTTTLAGNETDPKAYNTTLAYNVSLSGYREKNNNTFSGNVNISGNNITNVNFTTFCNGLNCWNMYVNASDWFIIEAV